jgi:ribonuclease J
LEKEASKTTTLTFYGGVGEIGGNKILLQDGDTRIFFDFGMSIGMKKRYYSSPFLSPRNERSLLAFGILPKINGIYKFDDDEKKVDAVFLTHSHSDHAAYISFIKHTVPIYCGETTATILKALDETRVSHFEFDLKGINFNTFRTGNKIRIGTIEVEPIHVDHSVPGAYGFLIHTSSGTIAYTGDFRLHGSKPSMSKDFIMAASSSKPLALITEGTNMLGAELSCEKEVEEKIGILVEDTPGLVLADFAGADVDRLNSFNRACGKCGRKLAVTMRQAQLMRRLKGDSRLDVPDLHDEGILVFQKAKKRYYNWEREIMKMGNIVDASQIASMQGKTVLVSSFYDFEELVNIRPQPESCFLLSASEPYDEEMELDFERLTNWLVYYGLPQYHIHVSGHIMPLQLRQALKTIGAKKVFPVHCQYPQLFDRFVRNTGSIVVLPEKERKYIL